MNAKQLLTIALIGVYILSACAPAATSPEPASCVFPIAFEAYIGEYPKGQYDVYTVCPDGSGLTQVTTGSTDDRAPIWSPNHEQFVYETSEVVDCPDIVVVEADGSNPARLTGPDECVYDSWPSWSPDGNQIAFVSNRYADFEIFTVYKNAYGLTQITDNDEADSYPVWSPDGQWIAYIEGDRLMKVWASSGGTPGEIYRWANLTRPVWSPDGQWIAFQWLGGNWGISKVATDGQTIVALTDPSVTDDLWPQWSPDGNSVAFTRFSGYYDIVITDESGVTESVVGTGMAPIWSPDGNQIVFVGDDWKIYVVNADGTNPHRVTNWDYHEGLPDW